MLWSTTTYPQLPASSSDWGSAVSDVFKGCNLRHNDKLQSFWVSSSIAIHSEPICPAPEEATSYWFTTVMWAWPKNPSQLVGRKRLGETFPGPAFLTSDDRFLCVQKALPQQEHGRVLRWHIPSSSLPLGWRAYWTVWAQSQCSEMARGDQPLDGSQPSRAVLLRADVHCFGKKLDLCYNGCRESLIAFETFLSQWNFDLPWKTGTKTRVSLSRPCLWKALFRFGIKQ